MGGRGPKRSLGGGDQPPHSLPLGNPKELRWGTWVRVFKCPAPRKSGGVEQPAPSTPGMLRTGSPGRPRGPISPSSPCSGGKGRRSARGRLPFLSPPPISVYGGRWKPSARAPPPGDLPWVRRKAQVASPQGGMCSLEGCLPSPLPLRSSQALPSRRLRPEVQRHPAHRGPPAKDGSSTVRGPTKSSGPSGQAWQCAPNSPPNPPPHSPGILCPLGGQAARRNPGRPAGEEGEERGGGSRCGAQRAQGTPAGVTRRPTPVVLALLAGGGAGAAEKGGGGA